MTKLKMNNTTSAEIWFGVKEGIPFGGASSSSGSGWIQGVMGAD